jgi:O-antigen ligase
MSQRTIWSIFEKLTNFYHSDYGMEFRGALAAWELNPWLGSGLHTQRIICEDLGVMATFGRNCTHPHNLYLHLGVETGIVGVSLFCIMLFCLYRQILSPLWTQRYWLALSVCFTIMTASFWPLIGGISVLNNWVAALVWLGVGCCLAISLNQRN